MTGTFQSLKHSWREGLAVADQRLVFPQIRNLWIFQIGCPPEIAMLAVSNPTIPSLRICCYMPRKRKKYDRNVPFTRKTGDVEFKLVRTSFLIDSIAISRFHRPLTDGICCFPSVRVMIPVVVL
jgi:hypothetical protein